MDIALLIATTGIVTEFIKKALLKIHVELKGMAAMTLAVIVSAGVVIVESIKTGTPFSLQTIVIFLEVAIGSMVGYSILTKKSGPKIL